MIYSYINKIKYQMDTQFSIIEQIGNSVQSTITVKVDDQPIPKAGDLIEVKDDATGEVLFLGTCGIPKSPRYKSFYEPKVYSIVCGNANSILANRIINLATQGKTITQIVQRIYDTYIAIENIELEEISDIPIVVEIYTAGDFNLQYALDELANLVQAVWKVTNEKKFIFATKENFPEFPRVIDRDFLLGTDLQAQTKDYKRRTVQIISGAVETTSIQNENFDYDGKIRTFNVWYPVTSKPIILVNGIAVPEERIGVIGLNNDSDAFVFLFAYNSTGINYNSDTDYLVAGDVVTISYIGFFPIRIISSNVSKMEEIAAKTGNSGIIENVQLARNIKNQFDALDLANSLLEQFETERGELSFWMTTEQLYSLGYSLSDIEPLTKLTFDLPEIGVTGDYVISERTIEPFLNDLSKDFYRALKVSLKLVDRDYLKSYGEIFSDIRRDITQLSLRPDEIVIDSQNVTEKVLYAEDVSLEPDSAIIYYATGLGGGIFSPLDLENPVYPASFQYPLAEMLFQREKLRLGEEIIVNYNFMLYAVNSIENGSLFAPCDLGNLVYPF